MASGSDQNNVTPTDLLIVDDLPEISVNFLSDSSVLEKETNCNNNVLAKDLSLTGSNEAEFSIKTESSFTDALNGFNGVAFTNNSSVSKGAQPSDLFGVQSPSDILVSSTAVESVSSKSSFLDFSTIQSSSKLLSMSSEMQSENDVVTKSNSGVLDLDLLADDSKAGVSGEDSNCTSSIASNKSLVNIYTGSSLQLENALIDPFCNGKLNTSVVLTDGTSQELICENDRNDSEKRFYATPLTELSREKDYTMTCNFGLSQAQESNEQPELVVDRREDEVILAMHDDDSTTSASVSRTLSLSHTFDPFSDISSQNNYDKIDLLTHPDFANDSLLKDFAVPSNQLSLLSAEYEKFGLKTTSSDRKVDDFGLETVALTLNQNENFEHKHTEDLENEANVDSPTKVNDGHADNLSCNSLLNKNDDVINDVLFAVDCKFSNDISAENTDFSPSTPYTEEHYVDVSSFSSVADSKGGEGGFAKPRSTADSELKLEVLAEGDNLMNISCKEVLVPSSELTSENKHFLSELCSENVKFHQVRNIMADAKLHEIHQTHAGKSEDVTDLAGSSLMHGFDSISLSDSGFPALPLCIKDAAVLQEGMHNEVFSQVYLNDHLLSPIPPTAPQRKKKKLIKKNQPTQPQSKAKNMLELNLSSEKSSELKTSLKSPCEIWQPEANVVFDKDEHLSSSCTRNATNTTDEDSGKKDSLIQVSSKSNVDLFVQLPHNGKKKFAEKNAEEQPGQSQHIIEDVVKFNMSTGNSSEVKNVLQSGGNSAEEFNRHFRLHSENNEQLVNSTAEKMIFHQNIELSELKNLQNSPDNEIPDESLLKLYCDANKTTKLLLEIDPDTNNIPHQNEPSFDANILSENGTASLQSTHMLFACDHLEDAMRSGDDSSSMTKDNFELSTPTIQSTQVTENLLNIDGNSITKKGENDKLFSDKSFPVHIRKSLSDFNDDFSETSENQNEVADQIKLTKPSDDVEVQPECRNRRELCNLSCTSGILTDNVALSAETNSEIIIPNDKGRANNLHAVVASHCNDIDELQRDSVVNVTGNVGILNISVSNSSMGHNLQGFANVKKASLFQDDVDLLISVEASSPEVSSSYMNNLQDPNKISCITIEEKKVSMLLEDTNLLKSKEKPYPKISSSNEHNLLGLELSSETTLEVQKISLPQDDPNMCKSVEEPNPDVSSNFKPYLHGLKKMSNVIATEQKISLKEDTNWCNSMKEPSPGISLSNELNQHGVEHIFDVTSDVRNRSLLQEHLTMSESEKITHSVVSLIKDSELQDDAKPLFQGDANISESTTAKCSSQKSLSNLHIMPSSENSFNVTADTSKVFLLEDDASQFKSVEEPSFTTTSNSVSVLWSSQNTPDVCVQKVSVRQDGANLLESAEEPCSKISSNNDPQLQRIEEFLLQNEVNFSESVTEEQSLPKSLSNMNILESSENSFNVTVDALREPWSCNDADLYKSLEETRFEMFSSNDHDLRGTKESMSQCNSNLSAAIEEHSSDSEKPASNERILLISDNACDVTAGEQKLSLSQEDANLFESLQKPCLKISDIGSNTNNTLNIDKGASTVESNSTVNVSESEEGSLFDSDDMNVSEDDMYLEENNEGQDDSSEISYEFDENPFSSIAFPIPSITGKTKILDNSAILSRFTQKPIVTTSMIPTSVYINDDWKNEISEASEPVPDKVIAPKEFVEAITSLSLKAGELFDHDNSVKSILFDGGWDEIQSFRSKVDVMPVIPEVSEPENTDDSTDASSCCSQAIFVIDSETNSHTQADILENMHTVNEEQEYLNTKSATFNEIATNKCYQLDTEICDVVNFMLDQITKNLEGHATHDEVLLTCINDVEILSKTQDDSNNCDALNSGTYETNTKDEASNIGKSLLLIETDQLYFNTSTTHHTTPGETKNIKDVKEATDTVSTHTNTEENSSHPENKIEVEVKCDFDHEENTQPNQSMVSKKLIKVVEPNVAEQTPISCEQNNDLFLGEKCTGTLSQTITSNKLDTVTTTSDIKETFVNLTVLSSENIELGRATPAENLQNSSGFRPTVTSLVSPALDSHVSVVGISECDQSLENAAVTDECSSTLVPAKPPNGASNDRKLQVVENDLLPCMAAINSASKNAGVSASDKFTKKDAEALSMLPDDTHQHHNSNDTCATGIALSVCENSAQEGIDLLAKTNEDVAEDDVSVVSTPEKQLQERVRNLFPEKPDVAINDNHFVNELKVSSLSKDQIFEISSDASQFGSATAPFETFSSPKNEEQAVILLDKDKALDSSKLSPSEYSENNIAIRKKKLSLVADLANDGEEISRFVSIFAIMFLWIFPNYIQ